jgi:hypothetical protein
MSRATRHWWGIGLPPEFSIEWSDDESRRCEGEVQSLYVRKTFDGRAGWHVIGMVCLGCGVVSIDEESVDALDPDVRRELADADW